MTHLWRRRATLPADGYPPPAARLGDEDYRNLIEGWVRSEMRWISRDECSDIAGTAVLEALKDLRGYRGGNRRESFLAWLKTITIRQCARAKHRWQPADSLEELETQGDEPGIPDCSADIIGALDVEWRYTAILDAVRTLGQDQRNAFILHHLEGMAYAGIAGMLGGTEDKWKKCGSRAVEAIQRRLAEQNDDQE